MKSTRNFCYQHTVNEAFNAYVLREFPKLFNDRISLIKGEVSIALHEDAVPYQALVWHVTQIMVTPLKTELDHCVSEGILVKMTPDEPSDWLNSF